MVKGAIVLVAGLAGVDEPVRAPSDWPVGLGGPKSEF